MILDILSLASLWGLTAASNGYVDVHAHSDAHVHVRQGENPRRCDDHRKHCRDPCAPRDNCHNRVYNDPPAAPAAAPASYRGSGGGGHHCHGCKY